MLIAVNTDTWPALSVPHVTLVKCHQMCGIYYCSFTVLCTAWSAEWPLVYMLNLVPEQSLASVSSVLPVLTPGTACHHIFILYQTL